MYSINVVPWFRTGSSPISAAFDEDTKRNIVHVSLVLLADAIYCSRSSVLGHT
jgi:hypothetical protein